MAGSKIKQVGSDALGYEFSTTSVSYVPTQGSVGMLKFNLAEYDGTVEVYLEIDVSVTFQGVPDGIGAGLFDLYDSTNSAEVTNSETLQLQTGGYYRKRTVDISSYFSGKGAVVVYPRFLAGSLSTILCQAWRLVVIQTSSTGITKTVTYIPIGANQSVASGTYAEVTYPKWYDFTKADYNGTVAVYYCATITDDGNADAMYAELYDKTASAAITGGELTTTSDTEVFLESGDLAANITNGNRLTTYVKRGTTGTGIIRNAFLKIVQTSMPTDGTAKLKTVMQHTNRYWTRAGAYLSIGFLHQYNPSDWTNATIDYKGECIIRATAKIIVLGKWHLTDDTVEISGSELTTDSTTYVLLITGSLTPPPATSEVDDGLGAGTGSTAYCISGRSILTITNLGYEAPAGGVKDLIQAGIISFSR